jgi:hypothetical protein
MRGKQTLVINGKVYDAVSGLPVAAPEPSAPIARATPTRQKPLAVSTAVKPAVKPRATVHATQAHRTTQKSSTLHRDFLKKPAVKVAGTARRKPAPGHVARSEAIQRFAPHPQPLKTALPPKKASVQLDITPVKHRPAVAHIVTKKHALVAATAPSVSAMPLSSRVLKEQLIAERLSKVEPASPTHKAPKARRGIFGRQPRAINIMAVSLAVMVLGGYLTYLNMPGLSVRVAAAQADVAASFPDYHPDGYRFNGPVAYAPGQVTINFKANGGTTGYTVTEQKSTWDSQAVYDNIVARVADDSYITNSQQGLTIYTYKGEAAWVNKGILYTVEGDAPLSNEQLLRIAASL